MLLVLQPIKKNKYLFHPTVFRAVSKSVCKLKIRRGFMVNSIKHTFKNVPIKFNIYFIIENCIY